jgi:hypothetical protein
VEVVRSMGANHEHIAIIISYEVNVWIDYWWYHDPHSSNYHWWMPHQLNFTSFCLILLLYRWHYTIRALAIILLNLLCFHVELQWYFFLKVYFEN